MTTLEKKMSWAQEVLSRKDAKLQEVTFPFLAPFTLVWRRPVCCQVSKQLERAESEKRAQEGELERKGRELFKTQVRSSQVPQPASKSEAGNLTRKDPG